MSALLPKDYAASEKLAPLVREISWSHNLEEAAKLARKLQANFEELGA
jgi:hypothetical protein